MTPSPRATISPIRCTVLPGPFVALLTLCQSALEWDPLSASDCVANRAGRTVLMLGYKRIPGVYKGPTMPRTSDALKLFHHLHS